MDCFCRQTKLTLLLVLIFYGGQQVLAKHPRQSVPFGNGLTSSAGMLLNTSPRGGVLPWCSVSLIRPDVVLSANHCVTSTHSGDTLKVFFPYEGIRDIDTESIRSFCSGSDKARGPNNSGGCSAWIDDLVIIRLSTPYSFLKPLKIGSASATGIGSKAGIACFGIEGANQSRYGIKHEGEMVISHCDHHGETANSDSVDSGRVLCFQFDRSIPGETGIGPFDSGGPMMSVNKDTGEETLIGVARGSLVIPGSTGDVRMAKYVNLTNPFYENWLVREVFSGTFNEPPLSVEKLITDEVRNLSPNEQADYSLDIRPSASRLIFTLNHEPGPSVFPNNLELQLPDKLKAMCDRYSSVEVCSVKEPAAGTYRVSVGWDMQCDLDGRCRNPVYDVVYQMTAIAVYDNVPGITDGNPAAGNEPYVSK